MLRGGLIVSLCVGVSMSKRWGKLLAGFVNVVTAPQKPWRRAHSRLRTSSALIQLHEVTTSHGPVVFISTHADALIVPQYHATREPETIAWIDAFETPCIYWDIGANVGEFALHAALRRGVSVLAFEPSAANYAAFCRNIQVNQRDEQVQAFCIALNSQTRLGRLNLSDSEVAGYFNSFESTEDCFGRPLRIAFRQSTIGFSIDHFRRLFDLPSPNYLKVDVDGTEEQILDGGAATLANSALRSVLIEMEEADTARNIRIRERLARAGFVLTHRGVGQGGVSNGIFIRQPTFSNASA
jgi:FkbM family methyltransferase